MVNADNVLAYLVAQGFDIPRDKVRDYLIEITSSEAFLHPTAELAITTALLHRYVSGDAADTSRAVTFLEPTSKISSYPYVLFLGVLTRDWPGLADCASGVVHERGWNISFLKGVTLEYGSQGLGLIVMGIKLDDEVARGALEEDREAFERDLRQASCGSKAKSFLLTHQTRKLEIYSQVNEQIKRVHSGPDVDRIVGEDGEAVKFFASRSNAYVLERAVDDLAHQIITNYQFVKKARDSGGLVQIEVENLVTTRERLTGITVAGFDRDISLQLILDAVRKAFPSFQRKFNKEFTTSDGITLYRIEVCDPQGNPADHETIERLRSVLRKVAASKKVERARWIESIGGLEHYARAIIPFLVKEYETTGQPQVFIAAGQANEFLQEFKLLMVLPWEKGEPDPLPQFFETIDGVTGLGVVSTHPPKIMGGCRVEMLDVSADLESFGEPEQIYLLLKKRIKEIVGPFRDFDEGMRRADRQNLERVQQRLPDLDEPLLREFYYHLDDFYRVSAPVDELASLIRLAVNAMNRSVDHDGSLEILSSVATVEVGPDERFPTATLIAAAYAGDRKYLRPILQALSGYDCTMSKISHEATTVLTFRVMKEHRPLPEETLTKLLEQMADAQPASS